MKTEIEFRVWSYRLKKMLYQISPIHSNEDTGQVVFSFGEINFGPFEFMQFIGIKDVKNGEKIFVGDIIRLADGNKGVVMFENGHYFHTAESEISGMTYWYEKIGNIYENPELYTLETIGKTNQLL